MVSVPAAALLLIDLENMIGNKAKSATLIARLDSLVSHAGPGVPAVAACAGSRITADGIRLLKDRGIKFIKVDGAKNAADEALLAEARRRADAGCRRFVVASNDSSFGQVADLGQLEIVIWQTQKPRVKDYTSRAASVRRLPVPGTQAVPRPAKPVPAARTAPKVPAARRVAASRTPAIPGTGLPGRLDATAPGLLDQRPSAALLAAIGVGALATGMLFGAGTVAGAIAARRLLRRLDPAYGLPT